MDGFWRVSLLLVLAAAWALAACSSSASVPDAGPHGCGYAPLGDPTLPAVVQVLGLGPDGETLVTLQDGDPVCPNEWSKTNLFGTMYTLELTLTERSGRTEDLTLKVVPACNEPAHEAECLCICQSGYVLGQSCAADAGAGDG